MRWRPNKSDLPHRLKSIVILSRLNACYTIFNREMSTGLKRLYSSLFYKTSNGSSGYAVDGARQSTLLDRQDS